MKYRNLDSGDVLPASWTDALQEFIGTLSTNLRLTLQAANVVQAVASAGSGQASVGPAGLWRYRTTSATATVSGSAGTKDIYVVASANSFATTPTPDTDNTDYNWYLQVLDSGASPTGNTPLGAPITAYTKVGELRWDGTTAVTLMRQTYGAQDTTLPVSPVASQPGQVPARIIGATAQTASLLEARIGVTGANVFSVGPDGAILTAGAFNADGIVSSDLYVDSPAYRVAGTLLAASHLSNGVTGTGAVVLAAGPALTGTPTAPTAATGSADTTIATTALVANKITAALGGGGGSSFASLSLTGTGKTTLAFPDTTTTTGITWGGDTTLYRDAADVLKTDDSLVVAGTLAVTGVASGPTAAVDTNTTQLATTAYVVGQGYAKLAGPTFTGAPAAPTAAPGTSTTQLATTAFVTTADALKANLASPTFTGTPAAPTAAVDTNSTQLATTAFVVGQASASNPLMNGAVAIGTSLRYARADHVHASDTSRAPLSSPVFTGNPQGPTALAGDSSTVLATTAFVTTADNLKANLASPTFTGVPAGPTAAVDTNTTQLATTAYVVGQAYAKLASPTFTGTPAAPTAAADTSTTQLATTAFVVGQAGSVNPLMNGAAAVGTSLRYSRQDHVHPSDTSRAPLASPALTGVPTAPTAAAGTSTTQIATTAFITSQSVTPASALQVRDTGEVGQVRAGRVLTVTDFTNMGLSAPLGLWGLGDLTDSSGNARTLTNKGGISPGYPGITGNAADATQGTNSTASALYIVNAAWQQITTGSFGCWMRTATRGVQQILLSKSGAAAPNFGYFLTVGTANAISAQISYDGTNQNIAVGVSDVADDRWHFLVVTSDGTRLRAYVDGVLEATTVQSGLIFASTGPLNIGAFAGDAATNAASPHIGRIDEAFLTSDVLSDDQVRNLYCASIAHTLGSTPSGARLNVRRRKRGGPLATTDFPSTPLRLHNFVGTVLTDQGSNNVALTAGAAYASAAPDGAANGAQGFSGSSSDSSTDAGLPAALTSRSYGCWFKSATAVQQAVMGWGTINTADARLWINTSANVASNSGADTMAGGFAADGLWHHAVVVEDNAPVDGLKRKLYFDGRLVATSATLNTLTLAGAARFRIGATPTDTLRLVGQVSRAFVIGVALTPEQVHTIYNVGSQGLAVSPKGEGDHIEAFEQTRILATFDTLEGSDQIDLKVSA